MSVSRVARRGLATGSSSSTSWISISGDRSGSRTSNAGIAVFSVVSIAPALPRASVVALAAAALRFGALAGPPGIGMFGTLIRSVARAGTGGICGDVIRGGTGGEGAFSTITTGALSSSSSIGSTCSVGGPTATSSTAPSDGASSTSLGRSGISSTPRGNNPGVPPRYASILSSNVPRRRSLSTALC